MKTQEVVEARELEIWDVIFDKIETLSNAVKLPVFYNITGKKSAELKIPGLKPVRVKASLQVLKKRKLITYRKIKQQDDNVLLIIK